MLIHTARTLLRAQMRIVNIVTGEWPWHLILLINLIWIFYFWDNWLGFWTFLFPLGFYYLDSWPLFFFIFVRVLNPWILPTGCFPLGFWLLGFFPLDFFQLGFIPYDFVHWAFFCLYFVPLDFVHCIFSAEISPLQSCPPEMCPR